MKPEKLAILNNKKEKLVGYFYKNSSKTIIIVCHGLDSINDYPGSKDIFEWYHSMGVSVYSFDFSGFGESEGQNILNLRQRIADIKSVIDYFSSRYKDIILYGGSFSGATVAMAALKYRDVKKLITINGVFSLNPIKLSFSQNLILFNHLLFHPNFARDLFYWRKNLQIERITIPTLVIYGEKDKVVNSNQSIYFYNKLNTEKKLVVIPDGDHMLVKKEYIDLAKAIPEWIKQQIVWR